jgi:putative Holliday junction resolvase
VAGIDFGDVRLGVALCDPERRLATPHATYTRRTPAGDAEWFRRLVREYRVTLFVVGLPVHLSGGESQKSRAARQFAAWLERETGVPTVLYDERFTTVEAEEQLRAAGLTAKRRKDRRDMLAAQILLRDFLASGCRGQDNPGDIAG